MGKVLYMNTVEHVDHTTGEITETTRMRTTKTDPEDNFVKMYVDNLGGMDRLPKKQMALLFEMLRYLTYEGEILMGSSLRERLCEKAGISYGTLRTYTTALRKAGFIQSHPQRKDTLLVNPTLFAKGGFDQVQQNKKDWEMTVRYNASGERTITARAVPKRKATDEEQKDLFE